jgi:hypothetical protein
LEAADDGEGQCGVLVHTLLGAVRGRIRHTRCHLGAWVPGCLGAWRAPVPCRVISPLSDSDSTVRPGPSPEVGFRLQGGLSAVHLRSDSDSEWAAGNSPEVGFRLQGGLSAVHLRSDSDSRVGCPKKVKWDDMGRHGTPPIGRVVRPNG